ncbi:MAG: M16 family metallopeptidase [Chitinophagales bacterium]
MKKLLFPFLAMLVLLIACDSNTEENTVVEYGHDFVTVENDPTGTLQYTLENGLTVYLSVNELEPRIQTLIAVRAGSKYDPAETTGLAHYLEHMVFKGTHEIGTKDWESEKVLLDMIAETYEAHRNTDDEAEKAILYAKIDSLSYEASKFAIANEYDKMISSLGAKGTNAYTSNDETVYINDIPSNELEKWMKVEGERFQTLVLRLFHTELETVYEEFNRSQDSDNRWVYQEVMEGLLPNHPYGTQTTIGIGEHLKNPSMYNIHNYFDSYYRPNNVAICLSGDLDPDATIDMIEQYFGAWENKEIPAFEMPADEELTTPITRETFGPQQEMVYLGFKFDGAGSEEAMMIQIIDMLLANNQAGLMDINLNLKQQVLTASSFPQVLHDHSVHFLYGLPKQGQTLEEVKELLLGELDKIKAGDFDDWLIEAVVNDLKLSRIKSIESNRGRAFLMVDAFINERDFADVIFEFDKMEQITKEDIVAFANANYGENYVVSYKRMGESDRHAVPKPSITTVDLDRDAQSDFFKEFDAMASTSVTPKFVDFDNDIDFQSVNDIPFAVVKNESNTLFNLYYIFDMGSDNDKELALAVQYLPYLGTSEYSAEELKKEFYRLGLEFNVSAGREQVNVSLSGLENNFAEGVKLFEHVLATAVADENVYQELVADILKSRDDAKLDKGTILRSGLGSYAKYGEVNPFTNRLSADELMNMDVEKLTALLHGLGDFQHRIFYYGQQDTEEVKTVLAENHQKGAWNEYPVAVEYPELAMEENQVFYVDYDMAQAELFLISKEEKFNPELLAASQLFNEYFGSGLSSIVFQEIREKQALAYAAYSYYSVPKSKDESHYVNAYVGTQVDKLGDAVTAMFAIMNEMPEAEMQFEGAKEATIKKLETDWTTGAGVYWTYESAQKRGLDEDIRATIYEQVQAMTLADLKVFFDAHIADKNYSICVVGSEENIDKEVLSSMGELHELSLEEVFGY